MGYTYNAIVVGGGSGGLAFAKRAAGLGARTCLIERDALGGTCVNRGCVPKKLLWEAAWRKVRTDAAAPLHKKPSIDFNSLRDLMFAKIDAIQQSYSSNFDRDGLTLINGNARLYKEGHLRVNGDDYHSDVIVVATGSKPARPTFPGARLAETSDEVFGWTDVPATLSILGGGYIGCELAAIFRSFGAEVTVIETGERLLDAFDPELSIAVKQVFDDRGIRVVLGAEPDRLERSGDALLVRLADGSKVRSEKVVAATGRTPVTDISGDHGPSLRLVESGAFEVDKNLQTSVPGIYAIGDCADRLPLTPVATRDGERLAERLFGSGRPDLINLAHVASAAFVMPPVAQIGSPGDSGAETGQDLGETVVAPEGHWTTRTLTKTNTRDGSLSGAALMGPAAPDLVAGLGALIAGSASEVTGVHPSFAEEVVGRDSSA